jgi:hypothetical protein
VQDCLREEVEINPADAYMHVGKDVAVEELKKITGQDFGYDAWRWRRWLQDCNYPRTGGGSWV